MLAAARYSSVNVQCFDLCSIYVTRITLVLGWGRLSVTRFPPLKSRAEHFFFSGECHSSTPVPSTTQNSMVICQHQPLQYRSIDSAVAPASIIFGEKLGNRCNTSFKVLKNNTLPPHPLSSNDFRSGGRRRLLNGERNGSRVELRFG